MVERSGGTGVLGWGEPGDSAIDYYRGKETASQSLVINAECPNRVGGRCLHAGARQPLRR